MKLRDMKNISDLAKIQEAEEKKNVKFYRIMQGGVGIPTIKWREEDSASK